RAAFQERERRAQAPTLAVLEREVPDLRGLSVEAVDDLTRGSLEAGGRDLDLSEGASNPRGLVDLERREGHEQALLLLADLDSALGAEDPLPLAARGRPARGPPHDRRRVLPVDLEALPALEPPGALRILPPAPRLEREPPRGAQHVV